MLMCDDDEIDKVINTIIYNRFVYIERKPDDPIGKFFAFKDRRFMKTHLPANLCQNWLNHNQKTVVVMRNPKDTLVSLYHFYKGLAGKYTCVDTVKSVLSIHH
jgi:hypothetical protein